MSMSKLATLGSQLIYSKKSPRCNPMQVIAEPGLVIPAQALAVVDWYDETARLIPCFLTNHGLARSTSLWRVLFFT